MSKSLEQQLKAITKNTEEVLPEDGLKAKIEKSIKTKKPLNVKFGVDPTSPDLHIGHAVALRKLRRIQDEGHKVTLIIGDFTALIGDPSGKKTTRPQLTIDEVAEHAETYTQQAFKILDKKKTSIRFNSNWLRILNFADIIKLTAKFTVARILERDDFSERYQKKQPISLHEFLYPVMQAYDSVVIKSDIELGGTDQKFNMLAGRDLQEKDGQEPQVVITIPILEGVDGVQKMSKSLGNHIGLTDPASEMFGKVMSIPDSLMISYFRLTTDLTEEKVNEIEKGLKSDKLHPGETKRMLAKEIITLYHGEKEAEAAEAEFDKVFKAKEMPSEIPESEIPDNIIGKNGKVWIPKVLAEKGLVSSTSEGRRMIQQGAVKFNNELVTDPNFEFKPKDGDILRVGKRKIVKLKYKVKQK